MYRFLLIFTLASVLMLESPAQPAPYRIGKITIDRRNIFDRDNPSEYRFVGALANSIHWLTNEHVIRNELLFREGDEVSIDAFMETERKLRALDFLGDIRIIRDTVDDRTIDVTVQTRDKWTLAVSPSYQQGGGLTKMSFVIKDNNFIGNGQNFSLGYNYRTDRSYRHAIESNFHERRLFGTRWGGRFEYKSSEELHLTSLHFGRGFFSDETRWAASVQAEQSTQRIRLYDNGSKVSEKDLSQEMQHVAYARSFGDEVKLRPALAYIRVRTAGAISRTFDNLDLVNLSFTFMKRRYYERMYLNHHGRVEDVPAGVLAGITIGKNILPAGIAGPELFLKAEWQQSFFSGRSYYLGYSAFMSTYAGGAGNRERTVSTTILQHIKLPPNHTIVARLSGTFGYDWSPERQLILGGNSGLRGYDTYAFNGQQQLLYNFEHRYFTALEAWIFRFDGAFFWDGGAVWMEGHDLRKEHFHNAAGFGLRIQNTKQQAAGMLRIDFPYNFDDKRFAGVVISGSLLFSAFQDMAYRLPLARGEE